MILTKKDPHVNEVVYGSNNDELIKVGIWNEGKATRNFAVMYVPQGQGRGTLKNTRKFKEKHYQIWRN